MESSYPVIVLSPVALGTNSRALKERPTGQVSFNGRESMGSLCPGKLPHMALRRERFRGTGEEHEDTEDPEQRRVKRKPRRRQN